jgi:chorismate dehydratase
LIFQTATGLTSSGSRRSWQRAPVSPVDYAIFELGATGLAKLRISIVEFLNTAPLVWGFTNGPLVGKYDLSFEVPSQCAESMRRGDVDLAIIPAIEYQRIDGLVALPGMAIAAKQTVRSLIVVSKRPIEKAKRIALDTSSRSTAALVRILSANHWGISPVFVDAAPDASEMLQHADAALVIGDPALRISLMMDALSSKAPADGECCQGDPEDMPVPGFETLYIYDIAHQWREMTGKPSVLAMWVGPRDKVTPEVVADFQASKKYGIEHVPEIAESASQKLNLPHCALERYLTVNINYDLDADNLAGLRLYFEKAAAIGLIPAARPVKFAASPGVSTAVRLGA